MNRLLGLSFILKVFVLYGQTMTSNAQGSKPLPVITAAAYKANYLVVIQDKGYTMYATEQFDETQQKASIETVTGDIAELMIFDYFDQNIIGIQYNVSTRQVNECYVIPMAQAVNNKTYGLKDNFHYFGGWRQGSSTAVPHMFSSKDIFTMNNRNAVTYKGVDTVDGINADWWQTTMTWPNDKDSFTVNYYFTPGDWHSPGSRDTTTAIPLRIKIDGTKKLKKGGVKTIHHYYEYLYFDTSDSLPSDAFSIPDGAGCNFFQNEKIKPVPKIADQISYGREIIDDKGNVEYADVIHDKKHGILRIMSAKTNIMYDFSDGVLYQIKDQHRCVASAILPMTDEDAALGKNLRYIQDIGPAEFYMVDNKFMYSGPKQTRSLDSDSWSGKIDTSPFDVHFAKLNWNYPGYNSSSVPPPLSMTRENKRYNFFNFRHSVMDFTRDSYMKDCLISQDARFFKILFFSDFGYLRYEDIHNNAFHDIINNAIVKAAGVKFMRVSTFIAVWDHEEKAVHVHVSLFAPPDAKNLYRQAKNLKVVKGAHPLPSKTLQVSGDTNDARIHNSAQLCEESTSSGKFLCRNFDLCQKEDDTYQMVMYTSLPSNVEIDHDKSCNHFARSVDGKVDISMDKAVANLKDAVKRGAISLQMEYFRYSRTHHYRISAFDIKDQVDVAVTGILSKFTPNGNGESLTNTELINSVGSQEECATHCLERTENKCRAFQYCSGNQKCALSASSQTIKSSMGRLDCIIQVRHFVADFSAMVGKTTVSKGGYSYQNVADANQCAAKCISKTNYKCESFDYCSDSKLCVLSKTHVYSVSASQLNDTITNCTHYSKNYILDFKITKSTSFVSDKKLETIQVSSAEQCAHLCRTSYSGQECLQFDYCSGSRQCQIVSGTLQSHTQSVSKTGCDTFTLTNYARASYAGTTSSGSVTYSNSSFGGLATGMIILGFLIGAAIVFALYRKGIVTKFLS